MIDILEKKFKSWEIIWQFNEVAGDETNLHKSISDNNELENLI